MIKVFTCGINKYKGADELTFCVNDVEMLEETLTTYFKIEKDNITRADNNGVLDNIEYIKKLRNFCDSATKDDTVVVYFSGHGGIDDEGSNYLYMSNSMNEDTSVYTDSIIYYLEHSQAHSKLVVLDCCQADTGRDILPPLDLNKTVDNLYSAGIAIMCSCKKDQKSLGTKEYSVFTEIFCNALIFRGIGRKGLVYLDDVQHLISTYFISYNKKNTNKMQTPIMRTSMFGSIVFPLRHHQEEQVEIKKPIYESTEFDLYDLWYDKKLGYKDKKRNYANVTAILKQKVSNNNIDSLIFNIVQIIKQITSIKNSPIEIIHISIGNDMLDLQYCIWSVIGVWTRHSKDDSWQENTIINKDKQGYYSYTIKTDYELKRTIMFSDDVSDEDIKNSWLNKIEYMIKQITPFLNDYNEYVIGDIPRSEIEKEARNKFQELNDCFEECDEIDVPQKDYIELIDACDNLYVAIKSILVIAEDNKREEKTIKIV